MFLFKIASCPCFRVAVSSISEDINNKGVFFFLVVVAVVICFGIYLIKVFPQTPDNPWLPAHISKREIAKLIGTLPIGLGLLNHGFHCRMTWLGHFIRKTLLSECSDAFFPAGQIPQGQLTLPPRRYTPGHQHSEALNGESRQSVYTHSFNLHFQASTLPSMCLVPPNPEKILYFAFSKE